MWLSFFVARSLSAKDTQQSQIFVHILMNGGFALRNPFSQQKYPHTSMPQDAVCFMVYTLYFVVNGYCSGKILRFLLL